MISVKNVLALCAVLLILAAPAVIAQSGNTAMAIGLNRIEGRVTDDGGMPVYNAYVELYSNLGSMVNRQRTTGAGLFSFRGMGPGRYTIRIKPFGTNLLEDSRDVEINNQNSRSDTVMVDFHLRVDKRINEQDPGIKGVVFAQSVPPDAKRLYTGAIDGLGHDRAKSVSDLQESINLFPAYFEALRALGKVYIQYGEFEKGYPFLLRAINVNSRCPDCYYSLGLAFYKMKQFDAGIKAADAAVLLSPESASVHLLRGMLNMMNNDPSSAEKDLTSANTLAKGTNSEVHWQLALVYNRTKRNQEAVKELEEYLKVKRDIDDKEKESVKGLIEKIKRSKS